jgi:hypothetical protein
MLIKVRAVKPGDYVHSAGLTVLTVETNGIGQVRFVYEGNHPTSAWLHPDSTVLIDRPSADDNRKLSAFDAVEITTYRGVDDVPVVQIETHPEFGHIRVNLNDGPIWDGDPDTSDAMPNPDSDALDQIAQFYRLGAADPTSYASIGAILDRVRPVKLTPSAALAELYRWSDVSGVTGDDDQAEAIRTAAAEVRAILDRTEAS